MKVWEFDAAAKETLCRLCSAHPGTPFLTLGQTVFWDEPTKAFFAKMLEQCVPQAEFWHGIHDTDYFSRLPRPLSGPRPYAVIEHNDSSTRGLWVAMCEASQLFGAEVVPTRAKLRHYGINLKKALAAQSASLSLDEVTTAWGWKGIASTGERELVARDVAAADLVEELAALVQGAMARSVEVIVDSDTREEAGKRANELVKEVRRFVEEHPAASLPRLYQHMLSCLYELLLGETPQNLKVTSSSSLFRFNPETAGRKRFAPLGLFLDPETRYIARRAYDDAVIGSGIYVLEQFGADAIPFDLVIPGQGRGTICVSSNEIVIHTPQHHYLPVSKPVEEPAHLAEVLSEHLGDNIALVGKAVMLIPMIAQEFILVFHEGASAYTEHTHEFVDFLEQKGILLDCHPILRLCHHAWDSLHAVKGRVRLPDHLAEAFGEDEVSGSEFSSSWKKVVESQQALLQNLDTTRKPAALFDFFSRHFPTNDRNGTVWKEALSEYSQARDTLARFGGEISAYQRQTNRLRDERYALRREIQQLQMEKGRHFRETLKPLLDKGLSGEEAESHRRSLQERIKEKRSALTALDGELEKMKQAQHAVEERPEFIQARSIARSLEAKAEAERLRLVRGIILTTGGLEQTDRRPTAWWFPLISPGGEWFSELARTSTLEVETFCPKRLASDGVSTRSLPTGPD